MKKPLEIASYLVVCHLHPFRSRLLHAATVCPRQRTPDEQRWRWRLGLRGRRWNRPRRQIGHIFVIVFVFFKAEAVRRLVALQLGSLQGRRSLVLPSLHGNSAAHSTPFMRSNLPNTEGCTPGSRCTHKKIQKKPDITLHFVLK